MRYKASCWLPDYRWENIDGFSEEEIKYFQEYLKFVAHIIMQLAREGGFEDACVKHAASVHPEPESNPPQKNFAESQHVTLKNKKIDDRLIRKGASHENLTVLQGLPATRERADDELAIIDYKEVVQIRS